MADKIINSFDVWITAQGLKSKGRLRSVDNTSLEGLERLRHLILQLAVRGKLTSQDDSDEPAKFTINRLKKEKEQKFGNEKPLPPIEKSEIAFPAPKNWEWCKLGEILTLVYGESLTKAQCIGGAPFPVYGSNGIVGYYDKYLTDKRSIIVGRKGSAGALNVSDTPSWTTDVAYYIEESDFMDFKFEFYLLKSLNLERFGKGIKPGVNRNEAYNSALCIPPLAEQHRIVAKVDELMALCDELEKQETHHLKSHQLLVETLLGTLTQANNAAEFQTAWSRLAQHFDDIFTTEDSIDQLKQTILQLAVMGKLVPQDPNDEPASELLNRIEKEKERLVKDGKIKKDKQSILINDGKEPYELPKTWEWTTLGFVTDIIAGASFKSSDFNTSGGAKCIKITNAGVGEFLETGDYLPQSFITKYEDYLVNEGDLILALTRPYIGEGLKISKCPSSYNKSLLNQRVAAIRSISNELDQSYAFTFLRSPNVLKHYKAKFDEKSQQPNMKMGDITNLPFPICSIKEQHRIVSKVEELFALCDRLKERIAESQKVVNQIAESVLEQVG